MRLLLTTQPAHGHLNPMVPLAHALVRAGHEILVATSARFRGAVERHRLPFAPGGLDWEMGAMSECFPDLEAGHPVPLVLRPATYYREIFSRRSSVALARDLVAITDRWRPDLVVSENTELGGMFTAERLGVPFVSFGVGTVPSVTATREMLGDALAEVRSAAGLNGDISQVDQARWLWLASVPPRWELPHNEALPPTTHQIRPGILSADDAEVPAVMAGLPRRDTLYASLGTVLGSLGVLDHVVEGLRDGPWNLVVAGADPARFPGLPDHVRVAPFVPQMAVLRRCALTLTHASINTLVDAIEAATPMVTLPLSADTPEQSERILRLGLGRTLDEASRKTRDGYQILEAERITPALVRSTVEAVLADAGYRSRITAFREEFRAMPGVEHAVRLIEQLHRTQQPVLELYR